MGKTAFEKLISKIEMEEDNNEEFMHYYLLSSTVNQLMNEASAKYFADDNSQELVLIHEETVIRVKSAGQYLFSKPDASIGSVRLQISAIFQDGVKVYEPHHDIKSCGSAIL